MRLSCLISVFAAFPSQVDCGGPSYDYVIVGGGTAGLALASRLSINLPNSTILVVEAGPSALDEERINIPGRKGSTLGTVYDWNFTTVPQEGLRDRVISQNRGKVLGGSSAINLMTYDRASAPEYDAWEQELGNVGWAWDEFSRMMMRAENFTSAESKYYDGKERLGTGGPVKSAINRVIPEHQAFWVPTLQSLGVEENREGMGGDPRGVSYSASSIDPTGYTRSYSANAYLPLAGGNLEIWTETRVAKIEFEETPSGNLRAVGVALDDGRSVGASREVVLSAGTFQSPGILEASGIGSNALLSGKLRHLIDLPGVGENLQDHVRIQTSYQLKDEYMSFDRLRYDADYAADQLRLWREGKYSMYDYTGSGYAFMNWIQALNSRDTEAGIKALALAAVGESSHPTDVTKLHWLDNPLVPQVEVIMSDGYTGVKGYPAAGTPLYGKGFFTLIAAVMHPLSRGSVHINPESPADNPIIDPRYLSNEYDKKAAVEAVKLCRKIATSSPLSEAWLLEYEPGLDVVESDDDWLDFVLNTTLSIFHPVGTCAMMPREKGGVVDSSLRVYGTENLRVVDASIIPALVSAHIQTAVYGIAEKAADLITQDAI